MASESFAKLVRKWQGVDGDGVERNVDLSHERRRKDEEEMEEGKEEIEGNL
jgi:hypothetical protein